MTHEVRKIFELNISKHIRYEEINDFGRKRMIFLGSFWLISMIFKACCVTAEFSAKS